MSTLNDSRFGYMFDGQGAFKPGFGKALFRESVFRNTLVEVSDLVGMDMAEHAWGRSSVTTARHNGKLQITLFALNLALARLHADRFGLPELVIGHSLGELSALTFAEALDLRAACELVRRRGILMEQAGANEPQDMLVVFSLDHDRVARLCGDRVTVSNINSSDQIVVSGRVADLRRFAHVLRDKYSIRSRRLGVGVACHSPLLREAELALAEMIDDLRIDVPAVNIFPVGAGCCIAAPERIRQVLKRHVTEPVRWLQALRILDPGRVLEFIEIGPSRVLKGFAHRSCTNLNVASVSAALSRLQGK